MKNLKYIYVVLFSLIIIACEKNDLIEDESKSKISNLTFSDFSDKLILEGYDVIKIGEQSYEVNDGLSTTQMSQLIEKFHSAQDIIYLENQKTIFVSEKKLDSVETAKFLDYKNDKIQMIKNVEKNSTGLCNVSVSLYDNNYYGGRSLTFNAQVTVTSYATDLPAAILKDNLGDFADKMSSYKVRASLQYGKKTILSFRVYDNANRGNIMFWRYNYGYSSNPLIPSVAKDEINNVWWELTPGVKTPYANQNNALYIDNRANSFFITVGGVLTY